MKKMMALVTAIAVSLGVTSGLAFAAHAESKMASNLTYFYDAVKKSAERNEADISNIDANKGIEEAKAVIAKSDLADAALDSLVAEDEDEQMAKAKELAATCDDDIEATIAEYKKEHTPAATPAVSTSVPSTESIAAECAARPGMYGRLSIPSVGVNVALFWPQSDADAVAIVDAPDSADIYYNNGGTTIGDHWNQGFAAIANAVPGSTMAYIVTPNGTLAYRCSGITKGHNDGYLFWDEAGNLFQYPNLIMYTCRTADWHNIWIVTWDPA